MSEKDFPGIAEVYEKVQVMNPGTEPVPVSLPDGLATSANQDDIIDHLNDIALRVATAANQVTGNGSLVSIDGKVLTNAQLRASAVPVSQASQPLPVGASTEATLLTRATSQNITDLATALINAAYNAIAGQVFNFGTTPTFNIAVDPKFPHTFLNVIPCNASGVYTASATGSVAVTVESVNAPGVLQVPSEAVITMSAPADVSFGGNLLSIRGTVTGITSTHYRVGITQNKA